MDTGELFKVSQRFIISFLIKTECGRLNNNPPAATATICLSLNPRYLCMLPYMEKQKTKNTKTKQNKTKKPLQM